MRGLVRVAFILALAGCASYAGGSLVPGQSTAADVVEAMGEPALVRSAEDGGRVLWYPRLPFGRESFAVRLNAEGRLVSIEQRLKPEVIARIRANETTADEVLDLIGPPNEVFTYPRIRREVWEYQLRTPPAHKNLYVQLSPDRVVREVLQLNDFPAQTPFPFLGL